MSKEQEGLRIEHIAVWAEDLETLRAFYENYFGAEASAKYRNGRTHFESYFLRFSSGARLELMQRPDVLPRATHRDKEYAGYAHFAVSVGSESAVDALTVRLTCGGFRCLSGPRRTGDGYYESVVLDPEGNRIEITV